MNFSDVLNQYIELIHCTAKDLSIVCGISTATISRYRSGERIPSLHSQQLQALSKGIATIASKQELSDLTQDAILQALIQSIAIHPLNYDDLIDKLNLIVDVLQINIAKLARYLSYDPSYLSRIRSKQRRPSNPSDFLHQTIDFIIHRYSDDTSKMRIAHLINCELVMIKTSEQLYEQLIQWFSIKEKKKSMEPISNFLNHLDEFNLNEYIRLIHFDELKIPTLPFQLTALRKNYYGLEEFKQAELDFLRATVLSKSTEPVYMCSDMPMEEMSKDIDFGKKWMFGIAAMLKKKLVLHVIHNLNRPFQELMLGLESWIPLYMTGQIIPYYLKGKNHDIYHHFHYCSGEAALSGESIVGFHKEGRLSLTRKNEELQQSKLFISCLFKKASPLMTIYRTEHKEDYLHFLQRDLLENGSRIHINATLPIYTISLALLKEILLQNKISSKQSEILCKYALSEKERIEKILEDNHLIEEIPMLSKEEFDAHPMKLPIAGLFLEDDIFYTYEDYQNHQKQTFQFQEIHKNYTVKYSNRFVFRNIQITIKKDKWAMISKNKYPVIHFVIFHPTLRSAIEQMVVAIDEK